MITPFPAYVFATLMIVAATSDALSFRIPNRLNLLLVALFVPAALAAGMPAAVMGLHLAAGAAVLAAGLLFFALRLVGGGDVKLLAAAAVWLGWPALLPFLVWTAMAGGLLGLLIGLRFLHTRYMRGTAAGKDVPYGIALAAGAIMALPQSWMVQ